MLRNNKLCYASAVFIIFIIAGAESLTYLGCFKENTIDDRLLKGEYQHFRNDLTPMVCADFCSNKGYTHFGLQNAYECFCARERPSFQSAAYEYECDMKCRGSNKDTCGGSYRLSVYSIDAPPKIWKKPGGYIGCFKDSSNRLMKNERIVFPRTLTVEKCMNHCLKRRYSYAGVEASSECYCSNKKPSNVSWAKENDCASPCDGNKIEICGGNWRISVYQINGSGSTVKREENLHYVGCYREKSLVDRLMGDQQTLFKNDNSPSKCIDFCRRNGSKYAGLQYSYECFCSALPPSTSFSASETSCDKPCDGNTQFICGGTNRLSVYAINDEAKQAALWKTPAGYIGCYKDSTSYRTLKGEKIDFANTLDVEKCLNHCRRKGFAFAGLEAGFECHCSNQRPSFKSSVAEQECSSPCHGKSEETCGGASRLSVYQLDDRILTNPVLSNYIGCYSDLADYKRALGGKFEDLGSSMTPELCMGFCYRNNFKYAGAQYSTQCFCGNELDGNRRTQETECDMTCGGNINLVCGGGFRNSVYQTDLPNNLVPAKDPSVIGCFNDFEKNRTLDRRKVVLEKTNTPQTCRDSCTANGFRYSGVEFGTECFCGNQKPSEDLRSNDFDCEMACSGDTKIKKCGGPFKLLVSEAAKNGFDFYETTTTRRTTARTTTTRTTPSTIRTTTRRNQLLEERPIVVRPVTVTSTNNPSLLSGDRTSPVKSCPRSITEVNGKRPCKGELIFDEEFSSSISSNKWTYEHFMPWIPDYEFVVLQKKSKNSFVRNGKLYIKPTLQEDEFVRRGHLELASCTGLPYSEECTRQAATFSILPPIESARITTKETFSFKYGKVEVRARLPIGDWIVPEIWLEPKRKIYGPSYASGRIRIAMARGNRNLMVGNEDLGNRVLESGVLMGVGENIRGRTIIRDKVDGWHKHFHNYTVIWTPDNLEFLVDGQHQESIVPPGNALSEIVGFDESTSITWVSGSRIAPFDQEFYISLGLSVGGMRDFPDESRSNNHEKPWTNMAVKAMVNFWQDRQTWYNTWEDDRSSLQVEHVRVYAL